MYFASKMRNSVAKIHFSPLIYACTLFNKCLLLHNYFLIFFLQLFPFKIIVVIKQLMLLGYKYVWVESLQNSFYPARTSTLNVKIEKAKIENVKIKNLKSKIRCRVCAAVQWDQFLKF